MKVLLVSPLPPPIGGITSWTIEYMSKAPTFGVCPTLVNTSVTGNRLKNNAKVNYFDELKRLTDIRKNIKTALRDKEVKLLHYNASCFTAGLIRDYVVLRPFFKRANVVYHCHCNLETNVNNKIAEIFFSKIAKRACRVLTLNKNSLSFAHRYTENVSIVPNFISQTYADKESVRESLTDVAFVGRVCKEKGIFELVESAKKERSVNFHIIGPDENHLLDNVSEPNIVYHGAMTHDDVIEFLKNVDALVLPSYTEGFPLVVLEGMALGLPIIASNIASIPDMIEDKGGVLVPVKDSDTIVNAIHKIEPFEKRKSMAEFNLKKVKNEYLSECVIKKMLKLYETVLVEE